MALRLSGMAAKNFALFVYAVLKDQKKTHGKTRLVRMLREQRPFKFFNIPTEHMREFATEAKTHGLLYVPIRNKQKADRIEVVVFADDASKVQRIFDNLGLDAVKAQVGEAIIASVQEQEKQAPAAPAPGKTETVKTEQGEVEFEVGGFEDDFNIGPPQQDAAENFRTVLRLSSYGRERRSRLDVHPRSGPLCGLRLFQIPRHDSRKAGVGLAEVGIPVSQEADTSALNGFPLV